MGCSTSKLDDEESVQLCKDRKKFIEQAVEQRTLFASGHIAYIQSLKRVSTALRDYIEGDELLEFLLDSFTTPPFTPIKKTSSDLISISSKSFSPAQIQSESNSSLKVNYLISGGNPAVSVEETPPSPEAIQVETCSPSNHFGFDGFFPMQSSPMNSSFLSYPSPYSRPNIPPPSPQASQWDFFWNPFSSLDYYGYPTRSSLDQTVVDDEVRGLRQVREEEGIPDLEDDETEQEVCDHKVNLTEETAKIDSNDTREEAIVEDVNDEKEETDNGTEVEHEVKGLQSLCSASIEVSQGRNAGQVGVGNQETAIGDREAKDETPDFTVYVNRRPTSMAEVVKDLEAQFIIVCNSAKEVSALLEASRAQFSSTTNELTAMKMLNPVALFRSASSRSSSSRFLINSSSREEGYESSSAFSDESSMFSGSHQSTFSCSHQSTLDRLYAWEKKLYEEVRSAERVQIEYEKKCMQLRNQDMKGKDPAAVDKTRAAIRDLHTQIKISIHSVAAVSKRIETLRDEELQPQLLGLVKGLTRMWKVMAECHQSQKQTLDEAKILLAGISSKLEVRKHSSISITDPHRSARAASNLETELGNWQDCFESWITSQQSYVHALAGWLVRCVRPSSDTLPPFSPCRSTGALPIFELCIQWSRFLDAVHEMPVLDGLDFFATRMRSFYAQQLREVYHRVPAGSKRFGAGLQGESRGDMEMVEVGFEEESVSAKKMGEGAIWALCAGMSAAMSSLAEFAAGSAEGYAELVKKWEIAKWPCSSGGEGNHGM